MNARGVGMMYKEARRSSSALGLRGMAGLAGGGASSPMRKEKDLEAARKPEEEEKEELLDESSGDEVE